MARELEFGPVPNHHYHKLRQLLFAYVIIARPAQLCAGVFVFKDRHLVGGAVTYQRGNMGLIDNPKGYVMESRKYFIIALLSIALIALEIESSSG